MSKNKTKTKKLMKSLNLTEIQIVLQMMVTNFILCFGRFWPIDNSL